MNIAHNKPTLGIEEELAAQRVIRSGWLAQGQEVKKFEDDFCEFLGMPQGHAVAVSSGTAALYLALWALNAGSKRVAFPSYVCAALRYAVGLIQGQEVIVDTTADTPNISIDELNNSASEIAIVPHTFGIPVRVDRVNVPIIIEDCCQALGAGLHGKSVGLHGHVGVYSFYATKLITSGGQGGMVASQSKDIIDQIRDYREFDMRSDKIMRFNFQMTDLQAAIGKAQLKKLPQFLERRELIFNMYHEAGLPLYRNDDAHNDCRSIRYRAILPFNDQKTLIQKLAKKGINAIVPIEDWELLATTPNALKYTKENISLPLYPSLTLEQVQHIIKTLQ